MKKIWILFTLFCGLIGFSQTNPADNLRAPLANTIAATPAQLSGKWRIEKVLNPKKVELPPDKVAGSYFIFGDDGKYTAMIMGVEEKGDWKFGPENRSVQLFVEGMKTVWYIREIDETTLVMQKGVRGNTVYFTR